MLSALVRFSVHYRGVVLVLALVLLAAAAITLQRAGLDIFPEFSPRLVIIQTEAPGFTAEQVETLVTAPIEASLSGLIGLQHVRSESIQGLSIVTAVFNEGSDRFLNRQLVSERLSGLNGRMPPGVHVPLPVPMSSSSATVMTIGLTSDEHDLMHLREIADTSLTPLLMGVEGMADVNVFGGAVRQLQLQLRPERLQHYALTVDEVTAAARQLTGIVGAGFVENSSQRINLKLVSRHSDLDSLGNAVLLRRDQQNILFSDVFTLQWGAEPPFGAAQIGGKTGVVMMLIGQFGANTLSVSRRIEQVLNDYQPLLEDQGIELHDALFRPARYIEESVTSISGHLLVGGGFVLLVLFLFLFNLRTAVISAVAIPVSLMAAVLVLIGFDVSLNILVIGGLAIALGEVVDDAIIDTENIFRRLRENRMLAHPAPVSTVVYEASMEVRGSVVYASFIVALAFVPLLTLQGVAGRLFAPLGIAYIVAILMSLLVALTLTPALCHILLGRLNLPAGDPPLIRLLQPPYALALKVLARVPGLTLVFSLLLVVAIMTVLPQLGSRFLPELREGHYMVHTSSAVGTSLEESIRIGSRLTEQFLQVPGVHSVSQWAGRAERGADTFGSHYSEYEVDLEPMSGSEQQEVLEALRDILSEFPGVRYEVNTFLTERIDETLSGYSSPLVVNLFGNDLASLDQTAQAVATVMQSQPGATDVQVRSPAGSPVLEIRLRPESLNRWGLQPVSVMQAVQTAFEGHVVGSYHEGSLSHDVTVILPQSMRREVVQVQQLSLRSADGSVVTLEQLADIQQVAGRYNILRRDGQRVQTVTGNFEGEDLAGFMQQLKRAVIEQVTFRDGIYPEFTGAAVEQAQVRNDLIINGLLTSLAILLLTYVAIGSLWHLWLVLLNLPFSLIGGVLVVVFSGSVLSVGSMVGFVTLFGITLRNSIMLVSHYHHLVQVEGCDWNLETALRGARERLPSILMTALVTALAMLPLALDSDNPGREIMGPMASIIIGGLVSSTILNLLIMPALMCRFGRFAKTSA